jgi:protein arginine kinase activator
VHYTEIKDNEKTELDLCEECAFQKGLNVQAKAGKIEIGVSDILAGLVERAADEDAEAAKLACAACGLTFAEFRQVGRLGCPGCYGAFAQQLGPLLRRIHGSLAHTGKAPAGVNRLLEQRTALRQKQAAMRAAVVREDFELAARLRDECRILEQELGAEGQADTEPHGS